jgi:hypothetical protein
MRTTDHQADFAPLHFGELDQDSRFELESDLHDGHFEHWVNSLYTTEQAEA